MDTRIGKHGEYVPTHTLLGLAVGSSQITTTRTLGGGYYCIIDAVGIPNVEELIIELKESIPSEPKRERKPVKADSKKSNSM